MSDNEKSANTSDQKYGIICAEMESAVDKVLAQAETEATDVEPKVDAVQPEEKGADEKIPSAQAEAFSPDADQLARALKVGLSVEDAKAISSADVFERLCSKLEDNAAEQSKSTDDGKSEDLDDETSVEDDIPHLPEDEDFDETLVSVFNKMGAMLKDARNEIASLKKAGKSAEETSWFDKQVSSLDEGVREAIDDKAMAQLKNKFEMLEAGYKATKAKMSRDDIFQEAASLTLGDLAQESKAHNKAAALAKRSSLHLALPGGESGARRQGKTEDDAMREVARLVSAKFGN